MLQGRQVFVSLLKESRGPLHPVIREEVYRIGREALVNAFRHSQGRPRLKLNFEYARQPPALLVRDNGVGWTRGCRGRDARAIGVFPECASGPRNRRELRVMSSAAAGTEIELSVPAVSLSNPRHF